MRIKLKSGKSVYVDSYDTIENTIWFDHIDFDNTNIPPDIIKKLGKNHKYREIYPGVHKLAYEVKPLK